MRTVLQAGRFLTRDPRQPEDYIVWRGGSGDTIEIADIVVNTARRQGRGRRLMYHVMDVEIPKTTKLVWAITRADNLIAQHFYEALNFRVVGVLRGFYKQSSEDSDRVDAIMYGRDIPSLKQSD